MSIENWTGLSVIRDLGISSDRLEDCDVLFLPENLEHEADFNKFIEASETIHLYKILKDKGVKVCSLHDFGYDVPIYERRGEAVYLGFVVVKEIALSVLSGIIVKWIADKIFHEQIHLKLNIVKEGHTTKLDYSGDGETLLKILKTFNEQK